MTISYWNQTTLNNGISLTTNVPMAIPGDAAADDALFAVAAFKPFSLDISSGTFLTDYAALLDNTSGVVANGNGVGSVRLKVAWKTHDGSEANPTGTLSGTPSPSMSTVSVFRKTEPGAWDIAAANAPDKLVSGTTIVSTADTEIDIKAGDMLLWIGAGGDNLSLTVPVMTVPGCTLGTVTLINSTNTTTSGNDGWIRFYRATVTDGQSTGVAQFTASTTSGKSDAAAGFIRMREPVPEPPAAVIDYWGSAA